MNEEAPVNAMGGSSPQGGGDIAMPERPLGAKKPLRKILSRLGNQGSLFPNTKKKIGLDLDPGEKFNGDLMKRAIATAKERFHA